VARRKGLDRYMIIGSEKCLRILREVFPDKEVILSWVKLIN